MEIKESLLQDIERTFGIKRQFASCYINKFFTGKDISAFTKVEDINRQPEPIPMYFNYAMTTNIRGKEQARSIIQRLNGKRGRYLDVGCAYGGFLVAFAEQGFDVCGIEINPELANYGKINCREHGLKDKIIVEDLLKMNEDKIEKFDVITCNDVIEHVNNPRLALQKLTNLLNPGGILSMEIPNKDCISFVTKDGHFAIFGITLLPHQIAGTYLQEMTGSTGYSSHMGESYDLGYYIDVLDGFGCKCETSNKYVIGNLDNVPMLLYDLANQFAWFYNNQKQNIDYFTSEMLVDNYFNYISKLSTDYRKARYSGDTRNFTTKYLTSFWGLSARK